MAAHGTMADAIFGAASAMSDPPFDQSGQLWSESGTLLVTSSQLACYKQ